MGVYEFVIKGECASKANSRRRTSNGKWIKSRKAMIYFNAARMQTPLLDLKGDIGVEITMFYASRRPDLDESLLLDAMQYKAFYNDRQIKEKHIYHALDKINPRCEVKIWQIEKKV